MQAREALAGALRERDEVVVELRHAMATVALLRDTVAEERRLLERAQVDGGHDAATLVAERDAARAEASELASALEAQQTEGARMGRHIDSLCLELEQTAKKRAGADAAAATQTHDVRRLEALLKAEGAARAEADKECAALRARLEERDERAAKVREENEAMKSELEKVARFQRLMVDAAVSSPDRDRGGARSGKKSVGVGAKACGGVPPGEVLAAERLAGGNARLRLALERAPGKGGSSSAASPSVAAADKIKWTSPSLNSSHSVLSRYYVPRA